MCFAQAEVKQPSVCCEKAGCGLAAPSSLVSCARTTYHGTYQETTCSFRTSLWAGKCATKRSDHAPRRYVATPHGRRDVRIVGRRRRRLPWLGRCLCVSCGRKRPRTCCAFMCEYARETRTMVHTRPQCSERLILPTNCSLMAPRKVQFMCCKEKRDEVRILTFDEYSKCK